ncbi:2-oxoglutarate and iron-dependent oxygenase domain-containing protein 3-like [Haliotis rufescens]|uniref:2-oxoglutarate and iron-dependent oxygenase domain-containing protein 3-like n=1 Tax=Haliotis rufescens TaxID=6454 RepID=UPI00201E803D|nr:2-oxoglutarate and iron-dependent oxygenase domain-containing protein 3-like [Haliotis rufescens]
MGEKTTRKRPGVKNKSQESKGGVADNSKSSPGPSAGVFLLLITLAAALCGYYFLLAAPDTVFVRVADHVQRAVYNVPCSKDYSQEEFQDCKPKRCGRVVMDDLVRQEDAEYLLRVAEKGLALGGSSGGASILDLHTGALSKDNAFIDIYRLLKAEKIDLLTEKDFKIYKKVKDQIHDAIAAEFGVPPGKLYLTKPTFFSRMNMTTPKTIHDEYWHAHVDKETYGSFHYTSLLYLATYKQDFDGGRFVFVDTDANRTVEPKLGRVSFFTSGSENVHFVERLTDGVRYAITVSFTCDPSKAISDPESR